MKSSQVQACIDFIGFSLEAEGAELEDEQEALLREILDGDVTADEAVETIIRKAGLDENFIPIDDENGRYPNTKSLVNYFNIEEREQLRELENLIVPIRIAEFFTRIAPTKFDFELLRDIHNSIFGDLYPCAGEVRRFDVSKRTAFCKPEYIESMAETIFNKLFADRYLTGKDISQFINDLAFYMGEVEALHPFIDGNGRAIRVFFYLLILNADFDVKWFEIDPDRLLEADISAIDGEYQLLIDVLSEAIVE